MPDESIKSRVGEEDWANSILEMRPMYNFAQKYQEEEEEEEEEYFIYPRLSHQA